MWDNLEKAIEHNYKIEKYWLDGHCLFKPLFYHNTEEGTKFSYKWSSYGYKGYTNLWNHFTSNELSLKLYKCKDITYYCGAGTIFIKSNDLFNAILPLFLVCKNDNNYVYLINPDINNTPLKPKVVKLLKEVSNNIDIIWTKDIESYCFFTPPRVRFKTFTDQKLYYQHIADQYVESLQQKQIKEEPISAF